MSLTLSDEAFAYSAIFPEASEKSTSTVGLRADGRTLLDCRRMKLRLGPALGQCECRIGSTWVRAVVTGEVITPPPERPNEGKLFVSVDYGAVVSSATLPSGDSAGLPGTAQTPEAVSLCNQLERMLKGSKAVDVEALCIAGGSRVWSVRLDVHVFTDAGNVGDAAATASVAALMHYRRSEVTTMEGSTVVREELEPMPLSIHHMPLPLTFTLVKSPDGTTSAVLADPTSLEERLSGGALLVVVVNQYGELCSLLKPGGTSCPLPTVINCIHAAAGRAKEVHKMIADALEKDTAQRGERKKDIHHKYDTKTVLTINTDGIERPEVQREGSDSGAIDDSGDAPKAKKARANV
ncbi:Exosome complex exonuclease RRP45, putative [Perkinsus marinus ATCC 50983]|uniref:Exosome complex exonuclease RRP45, putative n=1 Tax=Perkinsus marinus (strain ATCC 50983 / TXsc) TaxID=423536 RepID=C5KCZ9_PERM5|nr:Exosome complex exonuclease RRP45, putative [Perkinsus marinus ATCC 50983]EER17748.1 Exosome complex exonuclease RRP45, putative [Perkinsus marinus ATCC 50983]|eukprot:XP_002785952.1 Exosome complex exonuclease RRP45, putative [Perkinsus marinus ATCC 50983]